MFVEIACNHNLSNKCVKKHTITKKAFKNNLERNGEYICLYCSRTSKFSGNGNPNKKYKFDQNLFSSIDTEEKAYLLGLIASDGTINKSGFSIALKNEDEQLLANINNELFDQLIPIKSKTEDIKSFTISSKKISEDLCKILEIAPGKKSDIVKMPNINEEYKWHFIRGYFDGDGCVQKNRPQANISSNSKQMLLDIHEFCKKNGIKSNLYKKSIEWNSLNMLDFLSKLYDNCNLYMSRKRDLYMDWSQYVPSISGIGSYKHAKEDFGLVRFSKTRKDAVLPNKTRSTDSGYDVTVLGIKKKLGEDMILCETGIKVMPPFGYYFDLVPRSSIIKSGYILSNSIGVIDRTYRGEILVALIKIDKNAPDLTFPLKIAQLIPRQIVHCDIVVVESFEDEETARGEGGFGSTGF